MELKDEDLLLRREIAALDVRLEVVEPPEPAALAGPLQPYINQAAGQELKIR
jgi:hypothetical protein